MKLKKIILFFKLLNIVFNLIFGINFFKLDFVDYFSTVKEFKILKGIDIEDSPLVKQDKAQLKILLVFFGSFLTVISVIIILTKIGDNGSSASDIISSIYTNSDTKIEGKLQQSKIISSADDLD